MQLFCEDSHHMLILIVIIKETWKKIRMSIAIWTSSVPGQEGKSMHSSQKCTLILWADKEANLCHWSQLRIHVCKDALTHLFVDVGEVSFLLILFKPRNETPWVSCVHWEMLSACCALTQRAGLSYSSWRNPQALVSHFSIADSMGTRSLTNRK